MCWPSCAARWAHASWDTSGTLDPMATGVLAVFIGKATAAADRQLDHDKTYEATIRLGLRTDTGDVTGETLETAPVTVARRSCAPCCRSSVVTAMQLPPMYSAVKINGQPLYKAAPRARPWSARPAPSRSMTSNTSAAPRPTNTPSALPAPRAPTSACWPRRSATPSACLPRCPPWRRTQAGVFSLAQCHTLPEILAAAESGELETNGWVLPIESVFTPLPALHVNSGVKAHLLNGCPTSHYAAADGRYRTYDETGAFLGLASVEGGVLKVENYFAKGADCPMQIYQSLTPIHAPQGSAVALGYFDGVHCGHRAVLGAAVDCARAGGLTAAAFTFELPAGSTLKGGRVLSLRQKHARVAGLGIEEYQEAPFDEFRALTPEDFVQKVLVGLL